ncbi:MAG TPA: hypothetical protein VK797_05000 [Tepidisphaeraceae bacterium]|jgi:hypothetical protein|nr:hypothetical protein [Tepidisphaeraceae bacterium]
MTKHRFNKFAGLVICGAIVAIVILALISHKYHASRQVTRAIFDPTAMKVALATLVPNGTPIADAQGAMEREGFTCEVHRDQPFDDAGNMNYLYCTRADSSWSNPVQRRWQIAIVDTNGHVGAVIVRAGLVGP